MAQSDSADLDCGDDVDGVVVHFWPLRSVTMGARILSGVIAGFSFYISSEFFGPLSLVYGLPPLFGALAPSLVFLAIALGLLGRKL